MSRIPALVLLLAIVYAIAAPTKPNVLKTGTYSITVDMKDLNGTVQTYAAHIDRENQKYRYDLLDGVFIANYKDNKFFSVAVSPSGKVFCERNEKYVAADYNPFGDAVFVELSQTLVAGHFVSKWENTFNIFDDELTRDIVSYVDIFTGELVRATKYGVNVDVKIVDRSVPNPRLFIEPELVSCNATSYKKIPSLAYAFKLNK
ncbi:hypothetical protein AKO1_002763 [Acrasis kona]|uniref:Uncharacterized protein n=1 Tax=Acrasis kona TaxID=1008807 RepID=A0AAW2YHL4_9EUKA